jgi:hypothetical protein
MTGRGRADDRNLTGVWNGLYTYQSGRSVAFVATLIDSGGALSGTTHEPGSTGGRAAVTLYGNLAGSRHDSAVAFIKSYEQPDEFHASPIRYEGALNADATEIEGRWTIARVSSGKFMMIRSGDRAATVSRKAHAKT